MRNSSCTEVLHCPVSRTWVGEGVRHFDHVILKPVKSWKWRQHSWDLLMGWDKTRGKSSYIGFIQSVPHD